LPLQKVNASDKFIVLGSDGVFDFLTNDEVCSLLVLFLVYW